MTSDAISRLADAFGPRRVLTGAALAGRSADYLNEAPLVAGALLLPETTAEVSQMLRLCCAARQPVVVQGGLTNLVYNTHTGEEDVALSLERMNAVEEIDPYGGTMVVQAGAVLEQVHHAAEAAGLFFPLDLPARDHAVIGGLIGTNAGGLRVVRYGMMRDVVLGLEVVLADGTVLSSLNKMLKKNAGYDLKNLFIGAEGTLGVVTRAVLRLWPKPQGAATALLALEAFNQVADLLVLARRVLGPQLTSYEVMWNNFYRLTTTPPAQARAPLGSQHGYYVLIESLGQDPGEEQVRVARLLAEARRAGLYREAIQADGEAQRAALWAIRDDSGQIEAQYFPTFSFDVSLPIVAMHDYTKHVQARLRESFGEVIVWIFGHLADGNLHIGVWGRDLSEAHAPQVEQIVYQPLLALGGSVSAEHGIGQKKKPYLPLSRTAEEIGLMKALKATLDPNGILNPGKVFDLD